jgi:glycosyltransferase involved in cell wall biosynthesis
MELRLFPFPFVPEGSGQLDPGSGPTASPDAMTVTFVGGARRERGSALLPEIVARCASLPVDFFIQAKGGSDAGFDLNLLTNLRTLPKVRLHEGALELDDYYRSIARGIVLIPYHPQAYRWRASGVYYEAKSLGAPVIVSSGTWMAEEVRAAGNGLVFEEYSAASIAECIARARVEIVRLRANAIRCGRQFRESNGTAKCIDAISAAFQA